MSGIQQLRELGGLSQTQTKIYGDPISNRPVLHQLSGALLRLKEAYPQIDIQAGSTDSVVVLIHQAMAKLRSGSW
jgi:DNA-binding transcriptional LysR family regulator